MQLPKFVSKFVCYAAMKRLTAFVFYLVGSFCICWGFTDHAMAQNGPPNPKNDSLEITLESPELRDYLADDRHRPRLSVKLPASAADRQSFQPMRCLHWVPIETQKSVLLKFNGQGEGSFTVPYCFPIQSVTLQTGVSGTYRVLLSKGLTVHMAIPADGENNGSAELSFDGPDKGLNQFLYDYRKWVRRDKIAMQKEVIQVADDPKLPVQSRLEKIESKFEELAKRIDSYLAKHASPFAWIVKEELEASRLDAQIRCCILAGEKLPAALWERALQFQPRMLGTHSTTFYHHLNLAVGYYDKQKLWREVVYESVRTAKEREVADQFFAAVDARLARKSHDIAVYRKGINDLIKPLAAAMKERTKAHYISSLRKLDLNKADVLMLFGLKSPGQQQENLEMTQALLTDGWCKMVLQKELAGRLRPDSPPVSAPSRKPVPSIDKPVESFGEVLLYDAPDVSGDELIRQLRKRFPEKALLVDFWSTSCGACLLDMQQSKREKAELATDPIEFIYICLNSERLTWKQRLVEAKVAGHHFWVSPKTSVKIADTFQVNSYPTIMLVDQSGNTDREIFQFLAGTDVEVIRSRLARSEPFETNGNRIPENLSPEQKKLVRIEIEQIMERDQQFRDYLSFGTLDQAAIETLKHLPIEEQLQAMANRKSELSSQQTDMLWELQRRNDAKNHEQLFALIQQFGYPSPMRIGVSEDRVFAVLLHPPVKRSEIRDHLKSISGILIPEIKAGRFEARKFATLIDNLHVKVMRGDQVYGTNAGFDPKTGKVLLPLIKDIDEVNRARQEIGLPPLERNEYRTH